MKLNYYEWTDSYGMVWPAVQSPEWADNMRKDGYFVRFISRAYPLEMIK